MANERALATLAGIACDLRRLHERQRQQVDETEGLLRRLAALQVELAGGPDARLGGGIYRGVRTGVDDEDMRWAEHAAALAAVNYSAEGETD
jgi:hypothetical protein